MATKTIIYSEPSAPCDGPNAPAYKWLTRDEITLVRHIVVACTAADSADATAEAERLYTALGALPQAADWELPGQPDVLDKVAPPIARVVLELPPAVEGGLPDGLARVWP